MACTIEYKQSVIRLNNAQFSSLIALALQVASQSATTDERVFVQRMEQRESMEFWPGRGIELESDFPDLAEREFWARVFLDTARAIFDRRVGEHQHQFWQAQAIHQAYSVGLLFQEAVREAKPAWSANTIDRVEFDRVVNRIER